MPQWLVQRYKLFLRAYIFPVFFSKFIFLRNGRRAPESKSAPLLNGEVAPKTINFEWGEKNRTPFCCYSAPLSRKPALRNGSAPVLNGEAAP
jgi:hypothetical protein